MSETDRIVRETEIRATPARVWRALTDHREFGERFRVSLEGPFVPGRATRGRITYPGYEHLVMEVVTEAMEPERRFSFRWHPYAVDPEADYSREPPTLVEFTLEPIAGGTRVTVVESGFDSIPESRRHEAFRMNSEGWSIQMTNIERYVHGGA